MADSRTRKREHEREGERENGEKEGKKRKKTLWPLFMDGVLLAQG